LTKPLNQHVLQIGWRWADAALGLLRGWARQVWGEIRAWSASFRQRWEKFEAEDEVSLVVLVYFVILFGLLLLVHFAQPDRGPVEGSSRSPIHQQNR
jgi:hypothetical protein